MEVAGGSNGLKLVFKRLTQDVKRADFKYDKKNDLIVDTLASYSTH